MDNHYVPNLTIGPPIVKALRPHSKKPFDVHLMISSPASFAPAFARAGAAVLTFHIETTDSVAEVGELLDLAFADDTMAWLLDAEGDWKRNGGEVHLQEELIERQKRRRTGS